MPALSSGKKISLPAAENQPGFVMVKSLIKYIILFALIAVLVYTALPKAALYFHNKAADFYNQGAYEVSAEYFKKSLRILPCAITHYCLGNVYADMSMIKESIEEYKKAVRIDSSFNDAYKAIADICVQNHMYEEAIDSLKEFGSVADVDKALIDDLSKSVKSAFAKSCINKGVIHMLKADTDASGGFFLKAQELNPYDAVSYYSMGYHYYVSNDMEKAIDQAHMALNIDPDYWHSYLLLGDIYFKMENFSNAVAEYKSALKFSPDNADIYNSIGISLMRLEKYEEAVNYLKEAVRLRPDDVNFRYNLAATCRDLGDDNSAISEYKKLEVRCYNYPNMHNNLADIYIRKNMKQAAAEAYLKEAEYAKAKLDKNPDDVDLLNTLAIAYSGLGRYDEARVIISRVFELGAENRDLYLTMARIEEGSFNYLRAKDAVSMAEALSPSDSFITKKLKQIERQAAEMEKSVYLKNGRVIKGVITKQNEKSIVLKVLSGNSEGYITLAADDIKDIVMDD